MAAKNYFNGTCEEAKKIIHILILSKCSHTCKYCCNREYSFDEIPTVTVEELKNAEEIYLTGGEPFLLNEVCDFSKQLKKQYPNIKRVIIYTCGDSLFYWMRNNGNLHDIDGLNIAPKNENDVECLLKIFNEERYLKQIRELQSNRIYIFPDVKEYFKGFDSLDTCKNTQVIEREWQEEFEPGFGIFRRLPILFN